MLIEIPDYETNEWLSELKPYQRNSIIELIDKFSLEEAAEKWITATGPQNTVPFGGSKDTKPFFDRFKEEFHKFLCDKNSYVEERNAIISEAGITKALLISGISAAIGATIGYTATLLAPAAAILLCVVGKMGVNAYCGGGQHVAPPDS